MVISTITWDFWTPTDHRHVRARQTLALTTMSSFPGREQIASVNVPPRSMAILARPSSFLSPSARGGCLFGPMPCSALRARRPGGGGAMVQQQEGTRRKKVWDDKTLQLAPVGHVGWRFRHGSKYQRKQTYQPQWASDSWQCHSATCDPPRRPGP
jgi:hypothetical protein